MYTDDCVCVCACVCVCVLGLTPQMNEVWWDDEEDEDVLCPIEEHASKELLGEEGEQKTTPNSHMYITSHCKHLHLRTVYVHNGGSMTAMMTIQVTMLGSFI